MRVAVTGSNGMLGRALVERLRERRFRVIECNRANCDVLDREQVNKALRGADVVIHCAAELNEESKRLFEVNVQGTRNVVEAAAKNGASQFIFLSSVAVYGSSLGVKGESSPIMPETGYEKSKAEAEKLVLSHQELFNTTILRPAIIVGDNGYWKRIIGLVKKDFPLIGGGSNKWQMVCLKDAVEAIVFCIGNEACYGETFNVAEREGMTLLELVETIRRETRNTKPLRKIPKWLGMALAHINAVVKIVPMLSPSYVNRLLRERSYSTQKLAKAGWSAKSPARECVTMLARKYSEK